METGENTLEDEGDDDNGPEDAEIGAEDVDHLPLRLTTNPNLKS